MIRETWHQLRPYLAGRASRLLLVSLLAMVSGLAEATALLLAVRVAVDVGAGADAVRLGSTPLTVRNALLLAAAAELIALICHAVIAQMSAFIGSTVLRETRAAVIRRFVHAPWSIQSTLREGAVQELASSLSVRTSELAQFLAYGLAQAITLFMFVSAAFVVDWRFTLTILAAGAVVVFLLRPITRATQVRAKSFVNANSFYAEEVSRLATSTMELKSFGVGPRAEAQLETINSDVAHRQYSARFAALFAGNIFKDVAVFLLIGSVAGLYVLGQGALASAGVVVTLIIRGLASAQQASGMYQFISESMPNLVALNERLGAMHSESLPESGRPVGEFESLRLVDVGYTYDDGDANALKDVNLDIAAGDFVGVIGPSGGGKSTLLQLILRLRQPTSGSILMNGHDYRETSIDEWHDFVSLVPQEPSLLEATIAENIAYYRPIGIDAIHDAARAANIYDDIDALPNGFDTRLGPRGSGLSGGQKQRIAIARALAGSPSLLVMDEPTSALDSSSENVVLETIASLKGRTTLILVAHRMSTVASADYLIRVQDGFVSAVGSEIFAEADSLTVPHAPEVSG